MQPVKSTMAFIVTLIMMLTNHPVLPSSGSQYSSEGHRYSKYTPMLAAKYAYALIGLIVNRNAMPMLVLVMCAIMNRNMNRNTFSRALWPSGM